MSEDLSALDLPTLIGRMADIAVPEPVSYAPQTAAWWVVASVLVMAVGVTIYVAFRRRKANAYRRQAIFELDALEKRVTAEAAYGDLASLVRRTALAAFPRQQVASLHGDDWLAFLDRTGPGGFRDGPGRSLATAPYDGGRALSANDRAMLVRTVRNWIRSHRPGDRDA